MLLWEEGRKGDDGGGRHGGGGERREHLPLHVQLEKLIDAVQSMVGNNRMKRLGDEIANMISPSRF